MRKFVAWMLAVGLILTMSAPASAQLINWKRKQGAGPAAMTPKRAATPAATTPAATPTAPSTAPTVTTSALVEVRGTVVDIDKTTNQIIVQNANDGSRKAYVVDAKSIAQLTRYDQVVLTVRSGSNIATSVKIL